MKYFKDNSGGVYAYELDGSQDHLIGDKTPIDEAEVAKLTAPSQEELANIVRADRDSLLAATDWTASSDVTMSDDMRAYRQALRDVPAQTGFPDDVTWPTKP